MKKFTWVVAVFLFVGIPQAGAYDRTLFGREPSDFGPKPNAVTYTLFGGSYFRGLGQSLLDWQDRRTKTWDMGARLGWAFTRNFELEASLGFSPTQTSISEENVYMFSLAGLGQLPMNDWFTPYGLLGLGGIRFDPSIGIQDTDFALDYGVGIKFFVFKNLAIRPEFRFLTSFQKTHTACLMTLNLTYYAQLWGGKTSTQTSALPAGSNSPQETLAGASGTSETKTSESGVASTLTPTTTPTPLGSTLPDRDHDGVPDDIDQCPDLAGTNHGCPAREVDQFSGVIEGIQFETGKYIIRKKSYTVLNLAVAFFHRYPKLRFRVEGHTDSTGKESFNQRLSERRAEAVVQYFLQRAIHRDRMESVGFGSSRPIAPNDTKEGRAKNRRIEFTILNPEVVAPSSSGNTP